MTTGGDCFVIWFTLARRYLKVNELPPVPMADAIGWRPFVWTKRLDHAEKFASEAAAEMFLRGLGRDTGSAIEDGQVVIRRESSNLPPSPSPLMIG